MINNHTQLLNYLVAKHNLKSYLEVGVQARRQNFDKINVAFKVGVDPMVSEPLIYQLTSDSYFDSVIGDKKFDLIFLDGLHHCDQIKRDFENSLRCLNEGGYIVIHDTLPENEAGTKVPRETKVWWGDVWKFAVTLSEYRHPFYTIEMDNGCTVLSKVLRDKDFELIKMPALSHLTWDWFQQNKKKALRIIPPSDIEKYL